MFNWKIPILALAMPLLVTMQVAAEEGAPVIDPKATQVLKQMSDHLGNLRHFGFKSIQSTDLLLRDGQIITLISSSKSMISRPNHRFMSERLGAEGRIELTYDGQTATLFDPQENIYAQREFDGDVGALHEVLDRLRDNLEIELPAADLFYPDAYSGLMEEVYAGTYIGTVELDGVKCHHLAFRAEEVDWQLWVEIGDRPLPRRYQLTSKFISGSLRYTVGFQGWEFPSTVPDSMFRFKSPPGARKIEFEDREQ